MIQISKILAPTVALLTTPSNFRNPFFKDAVFDVGLDLYRPIQDAMITPQRNLGGGLFPLQFVYVCLSFSARARARVYVYVIVSLLMNKIPAGQMHRFGRSFC